MRIILIIAILLFVVACSKSNQDNKPWMFEETKQIINDYPDTLESSIQDAKKVTEQYNQNAKDLQDNIQNAKIN